MKLVKSWFIIPISPVKNKSIVTPMLESKLVPQIQYATVDEFRTGSNNFYFYFQEGQIGEMYRKREAYQRFEQQHPEFAKQLKEKCKKTSEEYGPYCREYEENRQARFQEVVHLITEDKTLRWEDAVRKYDSPIEIKEEKPWNELYQAYQVMSQLVYDTDRSVRREDGILDNLFLRR